MAKRRSVTPRVGNRPLAVLRGRMRSLQREAEAALERSKLQAPAAEVPVQGGLHREERATRPRPADGEGRTERLLSGIEREITRRLKSVLERLDLPNRRELEALDERIRGLEQRVSEQLPTKRPARRKTRRHDTA
jgi:hypothetical protein